jgi:CxxC motif-containing protein (DUF1111 family)
MKNVALMLIVGAIAMLAISSAYARPQFNAEFKAKYIKPDGTEKEKMLAEAYNKVKCNTCHGKNEMGKDDKKVRNAYGQALNKLLTKEDVKNKDKIQKALTEVEEKKAKEDGPTFGELLNDGKLPAGD